MLVSSRDKVVPDIVDHDKATNGPTEQLVRVLALRHASDHTSLHLKGILLLEGASLASQVVHVQGSSLG